ncbi:Acetolactate synthase [Hydrogenovibrio crunogenus]|uniref:Acetolactate synthase n=1 Tax=Hydrogenovibrio crunogenus TaxID=39765 RepID=A0A4P7NWI0_9GAMM|nr:acetolactate synthase large subunit [Hydrogenovibrio crunogenus]QBZ82021.1 Acetolactate synthase [Hydrogenovibrio crunogenus]RUM91921.1 MAG: acetolactate synthase large subunit [Thiomicrospira sp.]
MKASNLFVQCLENEQVEYVFGIPGEENMDMMDALLDSDIEFITCRHEQGAAFMADVYGRLTGKAGVCLSTLGPGATNLVTGVADANMDNSPVVAIAGQAATTRLHKESHQVVDLVNLFKPISKYATQILEPETIPEVIRKAFKLAQAEKPGAAFIDFPENVSEMLTPEKPLPVIQSRLSLADHKLIEKAALIIQQAKKPLILVGNGAVRANASRQLEAFSKHYQIPLVNTFMAKGAVPHYKNPLSVGTTGLQKGDYENGGFAESDLVICIGFDMVEYHPHLWNPNREHTIIHIDTCPAEVDYSYIPDVELIGNIGRNLSALMEKLPHKEYEPIPFPLREAMIQEMERCSDSDAWPMKPQKIIWDLRTAMNREDIAICDVGAHKMWMARFFRSELPNTCIISNGFASMGIAVPGAIGAKLAFPEKAIVAVTGDAGFMMNSQEIETALRCNTPIVILIWNDNQYGLINWKQKRRYGRSAYIDFQNPDFVKYAESFGATGVHINSANELLPALKTALKANTVTIIDCPVDYSENDRLTELLGNVLSEIES